MYASLETDVDYFDDFRDISSNDKRLVRVGAKTFAQTGTYVTILCNCTKKTNRELSSIDNEYLCQLMNSIQWRTIT